MTLYCQSKNILIPVLKKVMGDAACIKSSEVKTKRTESEAKRGVQSIPNDRFIWILFSFMKT